MTVALLPPVTSSGGKWTGQMPLTAARRYVRGPGNSRWHRIRCGYQFPTGRVALTVWCGQGMGDAPDKNTLWYVDEIPDGGPACGTCVGRALGAGQDDVPVGLPPLRFDPRWQKPPRYCPGSRDRDLWTRVEGASWSVGRCLACGDLVSIRAMGRGYSAWGAAAVLHVAGSGLVDPCPFHAWQRIVRRDDRAVCGCGWPS